MAQDSYAMPGHRETDAGLKCVGFPIGWSSLILTILQARFSRFNFSRRHVELAIVSKLGPYEGRLPVAIS